MAADTTTVTRHPMNFKTGLLPRISPPDSNRLLSSPSGYVAPVHIDRRTELLTANNQGETSQCVAYALAGWIEYYRWKYQGNPQQINQEPIYNRAKQIDGFPNSEGTTLEAGLKAAQDLNLMSAVAQESIREVRTPFEVKQALHRYGVVLSAFQATDLWAKATNDGWMQPNGNVIGGHAVLLCGYSDLHLLGEQSYFALQNSWGADVGWRGFARMSHEQFAAEFDYGLVWEFR